MSIQVQDINDHPPVFVMTNYTFSILENSPVTTFTQAMEVCTIIVNCSFEIILVLQATDMDNDAVLYTLAGQGSGTRYHHYSYDV